MGFNLGFKGLMMMFSGGGCGVSGSGNSNNIYFTKLKYHK